MALDLQPRFVIRHDRKQPLLSLPKNRAVAHSARNGRFDVTNNIRAAGVNERELHVFDRRQIIDHDGLATGFFRQAVVEEPFPHTLHLQLGAQIAFLTDSNCSKDWSKI